jgi:hypothetical protein
MRNSHHSRWFLLGDSSRKSDCSIWPKRQWQKHNHWSLGEKVYPQQWFGHPRRNYINELDLNWLRDYIGLVQQVSTLPTSLGIYLISQDPTLSNDTIRQNVLNGFHGG